MTKLLNRAKMTTATTGTGAITLGVAVTGFQSFAAAGAGDEDTLRYVIEEGDAWEVGVGVYAASGPTLTRTVLESSNAGDALSLSGNAVVYVAAAAEDLFDGDYDSLSGVPSEFPPAAHTHTVSQITDFPTLATVATSGAYGDLSGTPTIPSGYMADLDRASATQIRAMSGDVGLTAERLADALASVTISGASNWTPNFTDHYFATWNVTGNRTINNPSAVVAGKTTIVKIRGSTSTDRTISWGSAYKGNLPENPVNSSDFILVTMTAVSSTEIVVSHVEYSV